ncbi:hypothetical protein NEMBOFW57_002590 [Staphylotrichum longicolle]|uniref:tRNA (guanine-N(7)-)-methyltransferase non-catalytic subunit TRM82 n=1 Tax=Staphylotrichum longicolle TaxID=669026 RepID=A0AAD4F427_9PEZI|nr:hypothetical protein NEMBOFW57_002590 [Staphylotrichum longicolle]
MTLPYHLVKVCGSIVFAAQGGDIHSFSSALQHISTWKYPAVQQADESKAPSAETEESPAPEGPPAKRRKVENGKDSVSNGQPKSKKNAQAMPKRPCALALTSDNNTILSADKFGDVYALPLLPTTTTTTTGSESAPSPLPSQPQSRSATPSTPTTTTTPAAGQTPPLFKSQANELTVHTKRNLRALENQKISLGRRALAEQLGANRPQFESTLLLGHVSMLTAICVGTVSVAGGKPREYILTADRDEHIRVSRAAPQAHVIEGFCLGHEEFVSRLCVAPGGKAEVLISGGGDDDLFVWDWVKGEVLGRAAVLEHVKGVAGQEEASKVAVTRVFACTWEGRTGVFVVVERVPALFHYDFLEDNTLQHRETIPLPANPLDVDLVEAAVAAPRLLVAVDTATSTSTEGRGSSLIALEKGEAGWRQSRVEDLPAGGDITMSTTELQKILYSTESLRKLSDFD